MKINYSRNKKKNSVRIVRVKTDAGQKYCEKINIINILIKEFSWLIFNHHLSHYQDNNK